MNFSSSFASVAFRSCGLTILFFNLPVRMDVGLLNGPLAKQNMWAFSRANIYQKLTNPRFIPLAARIADFLKDRFNPTSPLGPEESKKRANELREAIGKQVEDTTAATLFNKMVEAVESIYRTNLYMKDRYSLAFRIDPKLMLGPGESRTIPYGVFFVHGRRCNGFHVRFRDIARGGLRIVSPPTSEHIAIESSRQFDEAYGLAFAQQLKNKDIPEGGR